MNRSCSCNFFILIPRGCTEEDSYPIIERFYRLQQLPGPLLLLKSQIKSAAKIQLLCLVGDAALCSCSERVITNNLLQDATEGIDCGIFNPDTPCSSARWGWWHPPVASPPPQWSSFSSPPTAGKNQHMSRCCPQPSTSQYPDCLGCLRDEKHWGSYSC